MSTVLFTCTDGEVSLPHLLLCDREDGGHLVVHPPREVWERSLLPPAELAAWSLLVAATGKTMLETTAGECQAIAQALARIWPAWAQVLPDAAR
jgi:hypothetical protein